MIKFKKIKKQDKVEIIVGKEKGKTGKVIKIDQKKGRVLVEGLNIVRKTMRKSKNNPSGGIKDIESFIDISNVMVICPKCNKRTRIGFKVKHNTSQSKKDSKVRFCKKCNNEID